MKRQLSPHDHKKSRSLGERLRSERKRKGKTARFVAGKIGISPAYLCDLERGYRAFSDKITKAYQKALTI